MPENIMITEQDKQLVRDLANDAFGHHVYKTGVYPTDEAVNEGLLNNQTPIPTLCSLNNISELFKDVSRAYIKQFHKEALLTRFAHSDATVGDVATRLRQKWSGEFYNDYRENLTW